MRRFLLLVLLIVVDFACSAEAAPSACDSTVSNAAKAVSTMSTALRDARWYAALEPMFDPDGWKRFVRDNARSHEMALRDNLIVIAGEFTITNCSVESTGINSSALVTFAAHRADDRDSTGRLVEHNQVMRLDARANSQGLLTSIGTSAVTAAASVK